MTSSPENPTAADVKTKQSLQLDVLKISALGGALLYGVLFLGYYNYYRQLGLRPEDLGVSYTYILVRSIGFIVQMLLILGVLTGIYLLEPEGQDDTLANRDRKSVRLYTFGAALFSILLSLYLSYLLPRSWPVWISVLAPFVIYFSVFFCRRIAKTNRNKGSAIFIALALLVTIILPTATIITHANALARQVLAGHSISPYEVFGVPILDVSAETVAVTWIGPRNQQPAVFGKNSSGSIRGLLLGIESQAIVLLITNQKNYDIVKIPSALVVVEEN
jgi:hypothetical protein